jgi:hypothetical protein
MAPFFKQHLFEDEVSVVGEVETAVTDKVAIHQA